MNKILSKYKEESRLIFKNNFDIKNCTDIKCKHLMNRWKIKHSEYINNVIKIEKENNLLKPYKEYNKIFENFNKNQIVIDHRYDIINIDLEKKYNKVYNKFINDIKKNFIKLKKTIEYKNAQKKLVKAKEHFFNSKINIELKKCSFKNCLDFHNKSCLLLKSLSKKLCDNEKKKYCKINKIVSNIDCDKLDYNLYVKITQNIKNLNK
jgi:hypothetical protein